MSVPPVSPAVRVTGIDHYVLIVADVDRSLAWYCERLGLEPERVEEWRGGTAPFPSVRISPTALVDLVAGRPDGQNVDHVCLVIEPIDLSALAESGSFDVVEGPGPKWGAQGWAQSLYVSDPDGNVVELRHY